MILRLLADSVGVDGAVHTDVLAYIPSPSQGVWNLGPLPLRAYALCIIIGIVVAIWWGERRWRARGGEQGGVLDVAMFAVPFGLVGGRLYHVATDWQKYFGAGGHPMNAYKIWEGGLGIWGAVFLGGVGAWIGCRVYRIPLPALGDAIAPAVLLAQAIGRLGNYFNQELYGHETTRPWGLEIYLRFDDNGQLDTLNGISTGVVEKVVQPTFLYEMLWNLLGVTVLVLLDRHVRIGHGRLFALYVAVYCFGRFFVELLRDDEATHIAGIRINSYTAMIVFLCAVAYFVFATKGRETPEQLRPGADRPWPWQISGLRRIGAVGSGPAERSPAEPEKTPVLAQDVADGREPEPAVAETTDETESAGAGNVSANRTESDAGETTGARSTGSEPKAAEATTTTDSGKNDS